jgi:hypothetical protein
LPWALVEHRKDYVRKAVLEHLLQRFAEQVGNSGWDHSETRLYSALQLPRLDVPRVTAGARFKYLCFLGRKSRPDRRLTETCFSQWAPASFELEGQR